MKATKGSMLEAEQKSLTKAKIVMGIVTLILFLITHFGLFHTYFYGWQQRAGNPASAIGKVLFAIAILTLFLEGYISDKARNETLWYIIWIVLILAALFVSFGFNMSLPV
jgi:predicted MFS family arabinose efflux permease